MDSYTYLKTHFPAIKNLVQVELLVLTKFLSSTTILVKNKFKILNKFVSKLCIDVSTLLRKGQQTRLRFS